MAQHRVPVVTAKDASNIKPGPSVTVTMCGESCECCDDRQGWEGYIYDHPAIGESAGANESAEDCAVAALRALAKRLSQDTECVPIPWAELYGVKLNLMVSSMPGELETATRKVNGWLGVSEQQTRSVTWTR